MLKVSMMNKRKIERFAAKVDLLGVLSFAYIIIYSVLNLLEEIKIMTVILLLIGAGGFIIDLFIVINTD